MGGLGVLLIAIGAIVAFALNVSVNEVDLRTVGWILMAVGAVAVVAGLLRDGPFWRVRSERHVSADGRHVVDETRTTS
jgi:hypothetical protein